jgi:excisionase family DNA binding protein
LTAYDLGVSTSSQTLSATKGALNKPGRRIAAPAHDSLSPEALMAVVTQRLQLAPQVARSLKADFRRLLDEQPKRTTRDSSRSHEFETGDEVLSTQAAADLVGVSRPFMAARIDAGEIALHHMAGRHRRVLRSQVLAWQERFRQGQLQALNKLGADLDDEIFTG